MGLDKVDILQEVIARTGRLDVTNIDKELKAVMYDVSTAWPFLEKNDDVTVAQDGVSQSLPTDFRSMIGLVVKTTFVIITPIPSFPVYLALMENSKTAATVTQYIIFNELLYVYPPASAETIFDLYYSYYDDTVGSITFPDHFLEALTEGVCFKIYEGTGDGGGAAAQVHMALYKAEIQKLIRRYMRYRNPAEMIEVDVQSAAPAG